MDSLDHLPNVSYLDTADAPGVTKLVRAMHTIRAQFGAEQIDVSHQLPDGHTLKLSLRGKLLGLERDDGWAMCVNPEAMLE